MEAFEATVTCVRANVPLEVEGVVEAFAAEGAQVPLGVVVTLDVSVQHPLVLERLLANLHAVFGETNNTLFLVLMKRNRWIHEM